MGALALSTARLNGFVVVAATGEIDLVGKPQLCACVQQAFSQAGDDPVVIDLSGVSFMDAQGLSALLDCRQHAGQLSRVLALAGIPLAVLRLLEITSLNNSFLVVALPEAGDLPLTA